MLHRDESRHTVLIKTESLNSIHKPFYFQVTYVCPPLKAALAVTGRSFKWQRQGFKIPYFVYIINMASTQS